MEFSLPEFFIFCGSTILIAMLLMEVLDWSCLMASLDCPEAKAVAQPFLYGDASGVESWSCAYPEARGREQSPINIVTREATVLAPAKPLKWQGYRDEPLGASLLNDGNTVVLFGFWSCGTRPQLSGGPLSCAYEFRSAAFRWGPSDDEGSEHSLDYVRYPMELQVLHAKPGLECKARDSLAIVSYFFQITNVDNPYLDHVVQNLWRITSPGANYHVPAFPLEWLFPSFERRYYSYSGSLTQPPCSQVATWIIQPEPLAISTAQMAKFRQICSVEGPILSNSRPVQKLNDREVFYYA
ncbi:carbonic anhydrase-like [Nasonia vitripennis]|uniref:Alpha-carbonic anhydrase domain-containing protein n=1 Tax=Nasonia vitripennis TaxID=7425 RepID=A0A7M7PX38_NASVI|nr:carbonic anhydrase-like [Nasonia vitripennis]